MRERVGEIPLTHPEVFSFLEGALRDELEATGLKEAE
jgi:hypothetical protein